MVADLKMFLSNSSIKLYSLDFWGSHPCHLQIFHFFSVVLLFQYIRTIWNWIISVLRKVLKGKHAVQNVICWNQWTRQKWKVKFRLMHSNGTRIIDFLSFLSWIIYIWGSKPPSCLPKESCIPFYFDLVAVIWFVWIK